MIISTFRFWIMLPLSLAVFLSGFVCFIISDVISDKSIAVLAVYAILTIAIGFAWIWIVLGELRTKAVMVVLWDDTVIKKSFLGLGGATPFMLEEFDGYTTSILFSNSDTYEYLYLMKGDKKMVKLSAFYHQNYEEMKSYLSKNMQFLGEKPFSISNEFKEILQ